VKGMGDHFKVEYRLLRFLRRQGTEGRVLW
jgi:hypothetical protein